MAPALALTIDRIRHRFSRSGGVTSGGLARFLFRSTLATALVLLAGPAAAQPLTPADSRVRALEVARGLAFLRTPALERVDDDDPALRALRERPDLVPLHRTTGIAREERVERAIADPARDRVLATRAASDAEIALALAHLIDAQRYPTLVARAARATGDPGEALRALLAASAFLTANGGAGPVPEKPPLDVFAGPFFEISAPVSTRAFLRTPFLAATGLIRATADREGLFRAPPLSTEQVLRPARWAGSDRPLRLAGALPALPGCSVVRDESLGLFPLVRSVVERGGRVAGRALAGWGGDRLVVEDCAGRSAWLYVIVLDEPGDAADFVEAVDLLLPAELERPFVARQRERRVIAAHGVDADLATAFGVGLTAQPIRNLDDL